MKSFFVNYLSLGGQKDVKQSVLTAVDVTTVEVVQ